MSVINATPLLAAAGGDYQISRSVRLRSSASAYFNRTPGSSGSQTTWTWSGWVKRGALADATLFSAGSSSFPYTVLQFTSNQLAFDCVNSGPTVVGRRYSTAVFRDTSAWYHVVAVWDTTNATASSRMRLYVNGTQLTAFSLSSDPSLNATTQVNGTVSHQIGQFLSAGALLDGYLTEVNFIDGQALTPSSFGETDAITGVWKPKKYAGTYGTNGFYLNFSDNSSNTATTIGKDNSGNGNNWTPNNISVTAGATYDSMIDVPTLYADGGNGRGNYCTLNPLDQFRVGTPSNGNLSIAGTGSCKATFAYPSGKWYYEFLVSGISGVPFVGVATADTNGGITSGNYWLYRSDGQKQTTSGASSYGSSYTSGDVIGVAYDADTNTLTFYKNNTSQGDISVTSGYVLFPMVVQSSSTSYELNFGQRPFAYTPPTGFKALNTQNLPAPTILKGNQYFDATLYTGNGGTKSISLNGGMNPDLIWIKNRGRANSHVLSDDLRGYTKLLSSDRTDAESSFFGTGQYIQNVIDGSFEVYTPNPGYGEINYTNDPYVAWTWKENASAGFDIVTYTGNGSTQNVAHSLGVAPKMIFVKARSGTSNWTAYHASLGNTSAVYLNLTNAVFASSVYWNNTSPTSTQFTLGSGSDSNSNGVTYVAYCFSEVAGFSKFGSYTGNGSADGPFVFCGFRPRFVMIKRTDSTGNWQMIDTSRLGYNSLNYSLFANLSNAESYNVITDVLSNGIKLRDTASDINASGGTYIFAAFGDPFKFALSR